MSKIIFEVPKTTDRAVVSIPVGKEGLDHGCEFVITFIEDQKKRTRTVTIVSGDDSDDEPMVQSQLSNRNNMCAPTFKYIFDKPGMKVSITLKVVFGKGVRMIYADWREW